MFSPRRNRHFGLGRGLAGVLGLVSLTVAVVVGTRPAVAVVPGAEVKLVEIGSFAEPVDVASAPGLKHLVFVVERRGTVRVLFDGVELKRPFLDIRHRVSSSYGEDGLLSIAFMPDSPLLYAFYTNKAGGSEIDEFKLKKRQPTQALSSSRREVLEFPRTYDTHNGGQLQFGPDNLLYISTGDAGRPGDPYENAQDPSNLLGKLLRIDPRRQVSRPSGTPGPYGIPETNPFVGEAGMDEIYALGLRNPWRFSFDRETGAIAIGDVGESAWEEVDWVPKGEANGANFGWDDFEGNHPFESQVPPSNYRAPIFEYPHAGSAPCWSITGGYVVRDPDLSSLEGRYLYGDYCSGELRSLIPDPGGAVDDAALGPTVPHLTSFGEGPDGQLFVASLDGPVYRIEPEPDS
jgi:glucose/arabinose dehydrogenase